MDVVLEMDGWMAAVAAWRATTLAWPRRRPEVGEGDEGRRGVARPNGEWRRSRDFDSFPDLQTLHISPPSLLSSQEGPFSLSFAPRLLHSFMLGSHDSHRWIICSRGISCLVALFGL